jgi:hypothetical protein
MVRINHNLILIHPVVHLIFPAVAVVVVSIQISHQISISLLLLVVLINSISETF